MVEVTDDGDECAIVRVKKFEGSTMLAEVDRTDDNGVTSRTRRRKVRKLQKVKKFEGSTMLVEVDRTDNNGVASRIGRCKVRKLQKSQLVHGKDYSKGTFSNPIDL
ncbi:hypothetical protein HU200_066482 [Digitaria exilis]|uniref:Uncharacterized protein n=1 Tax=Digitaria exilis TaxID=1010633 RepID=A0A835A6H8_9POAL|nr:hypothetical protein HU200_066482 [Digitaria exilis]